MSTAPLASIRSLNPKFHRPSAWAVTPSQIYDSGLHLPRGLSCERVFIQAIDAPTLWVVRPRKPVASMLRPLLTSGVLSAQEQQKILNIRSAKAAGEKAIARVLLKTALSSVSTCNTPPHAWSIVSQPSGQPIINRGHIASESLSFSVSHTDGLIACAINLNTNPASKSQLGVDVECAQRKINVHQLSQKILSATEQKALRLEPPDQREQAFLRYWTLKEAWSKTIGLGLQANFTSAEFSCLGDSIRLNHRQKNFNISGSDSSSNWTFTQLYLSNTYWVSLAKHVI